jgi:hypothetical protein
MVLAFMLSPFLASLDWRFQRLLLLARQKRNIE